ESGPRAQWVATLTACSSAHRIHAATRAFNRVDYAATVTSKVRRFSLLQCCRRRVGRETQVRTRGLWPARMAGPRRDSARQLLCGGPGDRPFGVSLIRSSGLAAGIASKWVREEYDRAVTLARSTQNPLRLIPVILGKTELPGFLATRNWVEFLD